MIVLIYFENKGACPVSNECDFESSDLCGYANDIESKFVWRRVQGDERLPDHSYGTETGHYMIAQSTSGSKGQIARLYSPSYPSTTICVSFWYKTLGDIVFDVRTYAFGIFSSKVAFQATGTRGVNWLLGQATVKFTSAYQIVFEAINQENSGEVWLDDIEINYKACKPVATCDFEDGICGFSNSNEGDFDWALLQGQFGLDQTLWDVPIADHTTNSVTGSFMYLDTIFNSQGKRALLESGIIAEQTGYQCLQFYLKTNLNNTATLNLKKRNTRTGEIVSLFTSGANRFNQDWVIKEVQLPANETEDFSYAYSIIFEGIVGDVSGQLAFDDVKLYENKCTSPMPPEKFDCLNGEFIEPNLVCDFKIDCKNGQDEINCGNCDFEDASLCGWTDKSGGIYKWTRIRNGTIADSTGPSFDHTFGNQTGLNLFDN